MNSNIETWLGQKITQKIKVSAPEGLDIAKYQNKKQQINY